MSELMKGVVFASLISAAALASSLAANAVTTAAASTTPPSVIVFNQKLTNGAVNVTYANIPAKGYIAVLGSDAKGMPTSQALGEQAIEPGDHRELKIKLDEQPKTGDKLWVSMYLDMDGKPGIDAKADKPVWPTSLPLENAFMVR
jgi:hypothetical protein